MKHETRINESEWQAQERAREQARAGAAARAADAVTQRDLLVAQALRNAPLPALPPDFARDVARMVEASTPTATRNAGEAPLERFLTAALGALLGIAGVVTAAYYGADWWQASASLLPDGAAPGWIAMATACIGMSWLTAQLKRAH